MVSKDLFNLLESYAVECGITYDEIIEVLKKSLAASAKKLSQMLLLLLRLILKSMRLLLQHKDKL